MSTVTKCHIKSCCVAGDRPVEACQQSQSVKLCHVMSCCVMLCRIVSLEIDQLKRVNNHKVSCLCHVVSYCVAGDRQVEACHKVSQSVMLCHVVSCVVLCRRR